MHARKLTLFAALSALTLSAVAEARPSIYTQTVPGVNFSAYKTYSWVPMQSNGMDPVTYQQIVGAFDASLASKGYVKVPSGGSLDMALTIGARNKTDIESFGWFGLQTSTYNYTVGQLSLDAFDTKTHQALWHGHASETVDPNRPNFTKVNEAITKLMVQFPATSAPAPPPQQ